MQRVSLSRVLGDWAARIVDGARNWVGENVMLGVRGLSGQIFLKKPGYGAHLLSAAILHVGMRLCGAAKDDLPASLIYDDNDNIDDGDDDDDDTVFKWIGKDTWQYLYDESIKTALRAFVV
ncbi:hypothetical protein F0562_005093 [Nyssa sinensis]|uniref:Uncharacterized protein n=1 Tax=Nyssa sinensis TaxID=561372 RepID=A0A5J5AJD3_9ASTE|nr:hypothetical protein F0562_005093 [Nyssa sinensis]